MSGRRGVLARSRAGGRRGVPPRIGAVDASCRRGVLAWARRGVTTRAVGGATSGPRAVPAKAGVGGDEPRPRGLGEGTRPGEEACRRRHGEASCFRRREEGDAEAASNPALCPPPCPQRRGRRPPWLGRRPGLGRRLLLDLDLFLLSRGGRERELRVVWSFPIFT
jgi:hypothetical protein